ncbi:DUF3817 domain-containing protein [Actinomycetospora lemnae]|uniref:DUF3817 domain-containing protein n=1 Tax=Actinomycetospora lemnae TaxID=3019891 RepID=UPI002366BF3E|nr:DUF3817 domain-containing protein [Actinomycetospora sp. DW7H6]
MSVPLRIAATVELVSLVVLIANRVTVHLDGVAALVGPVHGTAYLAAIALTVARAGWRSRAAGLSLVPGVGGWVAAVLLGERPYRLSG